MNSLPGKLLRFRRENIAITMDVQYMFYNFKVPNDPRVTCALYGNDYNKPLVDFQMRRHAFSNKKLPTVANYGICKVVQDADIDVQKLVSQNFYVDNGLSSCRTVD